MYSASELEELKQETDTEAEEVESSAGSCGGTAEKISKSKRSEEMTDARPGVLIHVRLRGALNKPFVPVLMPTSLSFESLVCMICICFRIRREAVKEVVKLPDIPLRSTEDVARLRDSDQVEVVVVNAQGQSRGFKDVVVRLLVNHRHDILLLLVLLLLCVVLQSQRRLEAKVDRLSAAVRQSNDGVCPGDALNTVFASVKQSLDSRMQSVLEEIGKINANPQELFNIPKSLENIASYFTDFADRFNGQT